MSTLFQNPGAPMEEPISKSEKKRQAQALTNLGDELIGLPALALDKLPLPDNLRQAIMDAKKIKSFGARKRQMLLVGKLLRGVENEPIIEAYNALLDEQSGQAQKFHMVEQWRSRLLQEDKEALTEFIETYHPQDIQLLKQLIKKGKEEALKPQKSSSAAKALFRQIRSCIL
jgi:ribosome-associated protein